MRPHQLLSIDDVGHILKACTRGRDQLLVCLFFSDLAVEDVLRLRHGDLDVQQGIIHVVPRDEEGRYPRRKMAHPYAVPFSPRAQFCYEHYLADELPKACMHPE